MVLAGECIVTRAKFPSRGLSQCLYGERAAVAVAPQSSLTATTKGLGVAFNQWPTDDKKGNQDKPGQKIVLSIVPYTAFAWDLVQPESKSSIITALCSLNGCI